MPSAFRSLRNRNAKYFFAGVLVSNVGTWMQFTASAFLLYRLTGKATDLGLNVMFQFLPMLLLGAWAGAIADRHNRRRMTLITQTALALQSLAACGSAGRPARHRLALRHQRSVVRCNSPQHCRHGHVVAASGPTGSTWWQTRARGNGVHP
ncbi:MAG: hypothetical protein EBU67_02825 [Actinobacteria bacterium]|nr:hypothetical protein [Actinomycetota bacterium]